MGLGRLRNTGRDDADVTWRGRSFQVRAAATGKARSPTVDSHVRRTGSDVVSADRRRVLIPRSAGWRSSSARYVGAVPWWFEFSDLFYFSTYAVQTGVFCDSATAENRGKRQIYCREYREVTVLTAIKTTFRKTTAALRRQKYP